MFSFLFYNPNKCHYPSLVDPDVLFLTCSHCLYDCIITDNHIQQIVCICCPNASEIIDEIQQRQDGVLIYWCKEHGDHQTNSIHAHNVRNDIVFDSHSEWEFTGRLILLEACCINNNKVQASDEIQQIRMIEQRLRDTAPPSTDVVDQQGDIPTNTSNEFNESVQTE